MHQQDLSQAITLVQLSGSGCSTGFLCARHQPPALAVVGSLHGFGPVLLYDSVAFTYVFLPISPFGPHSQAARLNLASRRAVCHLAWQRL